MTTVRGVQAHELAGLRDKITPLLERALSRQRAYSLADITESLKSGRRQLFVTDPEFDCALVTEIPVYAHEKVLHILLIAGRLPADWRGWLDTLEQWAADQGCSAVQLIGRRGWARKLPGYSAPHVLLRKELPHVAT